MTETFLFMIVARSFRVGFGNSIFQCADNHGKKKGHHIVAIKYCFKVPVLCKVEGVFILAVNLAVHTTPHRGCGKRLSTSNSAYSPATIHNAESAERLHEYIGSFFGGVMEGEF